MDKASVIHAAPPASPNSSARRMPSKGTVTGRYSSVAENPASVMETGIAVTPSSMRIEWANATRSMEAPWRPPRWALSAAPPRRPQKDAGARPAAGHAARVRRGRGERGGGASPGPGRRGRSRPLPSSRTLPGVTRRWCLPGRWLSLLRRRPSCDRQAGHRGGTRRASRSWCGRGRPRGRRARRHRRASVQGGARPRHGRPRDRRPARASSAEFEAT